MFTTKLEIDALSATAKDLGGKLFLELEEWEVFKPEDEKQFDKEIADVISHNKLSFKECCMSYDIEGVGFINVEDFMDTLETLELEFDESCLRYMLLLFYSHSFDLNRVPYKQFIKAYSTLEVSQHESTEVEESSIDEEERAAVVRDCLTKISEAIGKRHPN
jgi:Ca2+-binding EF-hand superfamily protein